MPRKVLITQSNYIPWKGYFDAMALVDLVILYDDVQYTRRDWRNRNCIKTLAGLKWLSIPVAVKGRPRQAVKDVRIADPRWARRHWETLRHAYRAAPAFAEVKDWLEALYRTADDTFLSALNHRFLSAINDFLGIRTPMRFSMEFQLEGDRTGRLVHLCRQVGATDYYTGPAARAYLEEDKFAAAGIRVHYLDYSGYPEYPQLHGPFEHHVSIVDLLFHTGKQAPRYMKYVQ